MKVSIEDIKSDDGCGNSITYIATSEDECRDSVDREVYRLVVECNDQIRMGSVLGVPMKEEKPTPWYLEEISDKFHSGGAE